MLDAARVGDPAGALAADQDRQLQSPAGREGAVAGELLEQVVVSELLELLVRAGHAHREVTTFRRV